MAKALLVGSGSSGIDSSDVTAKRENVLQGYRTVTADSNDEVVEGTITSINTGANNNRLNKSASYGIDNWTDTNNPIFYIDLAHGNAYYNRYDGRPHVCIDADKLGNATADKVLAGNTCTSKNGVSMSGTMANRGNGMDTVEFVNAHWENKFVARMEQGYYSQNGQWKPYVSIPYAVLANVAGVDTAKMLKSLTIAGRQGQIEERGSYMDAVGVWYHGASGNFVGQIPPGYYGADNGNNRTNVNIKKQDIVNVLGLNPDLWLNTFQTMGIQGKIPRWVSNSHVISAVNNEGFVWDDDTGANRGRGIVSKIAKGQYIENADWVFLSSPNLYPQNVVKGININGVTGTRDFADKVNDYTVAANLEISMSNREQVIQLGNAYSGSETVFFGVDLVGEDVYDGFVRRDKGNGHYLIGRIPVSKSDSNLIGTYIRNVPVQIEIIRDGAGNISLVHHGPNQLLGVTKLNVYIYAHSSISFRL